VPGHYTVQIKRSALKGLQGLPRHLQAQLRKQIDSLAENPRPSRVIKLAGDENLYRVRVGDYRVIYQIQDKALLVLVIKIGHRREVYR
jgi:mRNA interferase RelE/StbE